MKQVKQPSVRNFWLFVLLEIALVFFGNLHHSNQQQIFAERFLPLARNLLATCSYATLGGAPTLYPIWGYSLLLLPGVLLGHPVFYLMVVQALLAFFGVVAFYRAFQLQKKYWHLPLLLPFFALLSVKWPDAIVAGLLILILARIARYLKEQKRNDLLWTAIYGAALVNFRTEYLYLPLFLTVLLLLPRLRSVRKHFALIHLVWLVAGVVGLLPWGIRSLSNTGTFRLSSTNDGGVLYISLGELPNNPWHLRYNDSTAYEYVHSIGIADPYSIPGNAALEQAFEGDVRQSPIGFVEKTGYNIASAFCKGLYTGEYANLFMTKEQRESIDNEINSAHGISKRLSIVTSLPLSEQIPIEIEKLLQLCFMAAFFIMLLLTARSILHGANESTLNSVLLICGGMILYKLLLVGFIQYEPRHMNAVYLMVLGCAMLKVKKDE